MKNSSFEKELISLVGDKGWISSEGSEPWQRDWLNKFGVLPLGVALPFSTNEVSEVIKLCNKHNVHVVPRGGNTSLVGGSITNSERGILLSLSKMNRILSIDSNSFNVSLESGVILGSLHQILSQHQLMLPMHLGSEGSAQIGGLLATNAGGNHAFRYGMMQDLLLGLEVVLPDGTIWDGMRFVQKDNTGYQLRKLFCGSEGTLGVITKAILRLYPIKIQKFTALLSVTDASALMNLYKKLYAEAGEFLLAIEFFSDTGLEILLDNIPEITFPLNTRSSYYMLVEAGSSSKQIPIESIFSQIIEWGMDSKIIQDGAIAQNEAQRLLFWRLREEQPEGQLRLGPQLKHDLSVPIGLIDKFLRDANKICQNLLKGIRINAFGHFGDGNIHFNLSPPLGKNNFLSKENLISEAIYELANRMGGSFAAEHGIGRMKLNLANKLRSRSEREIMQSIKNTIDPNNQLNPGVIVNGD